MTHIRLDEIKNIKAAVMEYVEGVAEFDFPKGVKPWHPDGLKFSYDPKEGKLVRETILESKPDLSDEQIEQARKVVHQRGTIESVDCTGTIAAVKLLWVSERKGSRQEFTDHILLLKIQDDWKIVSKVSYSA
jgi:hypothetical protein